MAYAPWKLSYQEPYFKKFKKIYRCKNVNFKIKYCNKTNYWDIKQGQAGENTKKQLNILNEICLGTAQFGFPYSLDKS